MNYFSFLMRVKASAGLCLFAVLFVALTTAQARSTYYIDPVGGDDTKTGTTTTTAWKTLEKMNRYFPAKCVTFVAGDTILLKAGTTFNQSQIAPIGNGTKTNPIVIDKYGTGANPVINCHLGHDEAAGSTGQDNGKDNGAAILFNNNSIGGWEINNLEITNPNGMGGIKVASSSFATCEYFHFNNLKIHNIQGTPVPGESSFMGGIMFKMGTSLVNDVLINNCEIYDVAMIGIQTGYWEGTDIPNKTTNFVIRNTKVHDCGQLGIILRSSNKALIDKCTIYKTGLAKNAESFGIRLKYNIGSKIQYCEAYQNLSKDNSGEGGQGFTFDGGAVACTLQYSYSHNNLGGFMSVISDPGEISSNNVIRYNVSQNDSNQTFWLGVSGSASTNTSIYNNSIYVASSIPLVKVVDYESGTNTSFKNNIFYINKSATYDAGPSWDYNCFFGSNTNQPTDAHKITTDPLFITAGGASTGIASAAVYKLKPGSPCIDAGTAITNNGGKDFWGSSVPYNGKTEIGAYEGPGTTVVDPPQQNLPPVCSFASPVIGAALIAPANISVTVTATDPDGSISKVDLYKNDVLVRTETGAPYSWTTDAALQNLAAGSYTLKAIAIDNIGAADTSTITITVTTSSSIRVHSNSLKVGNSGEATVQVINLRGQVVRTEKVIGSRQFNLNGLSSGVYQVSVRTPNGIEFAKIVK